MSRKKLCSRKKKKREAEVRMKLRRRRVALDSRRKLEESQRCAPTKGHTLRLEEEAPIPPLSGPCPIHPEAVFEKCKHGCLELFLQHRSRVAGDVYVVPVVSEDPRAGCTGRELDPALNALNEISSVLTNGL